MVASEERTAKVTLGFTAVVASLGVMTRLNATTWMPVGGSVPVEVAEAVAVEVALGVREGVGRGVVEGKAVGRVAVALEEGEREG